MWKESLALVLFVFAPLARAGVWITLLPLQQERQEIAVAAANGRLYAIGGIRGSSVLASVEEFDPQTNRWRFAAPLPEPLHHSAAAVVDDAIYVIGGYRTLAFDPTSAVYRYDPRADLWTGVASLPSPRGALAAAAIDGRIYAVGGVPGGNSLTMYDPLIDRWTALAPMPTAREHLAAAAAGGKLYVAGGRLAGNVAAFEVYDPATDRWTALASLPTARSGLAAAFANNRIYVFGGEGNPASRSGVFEQNEAYDIEAGTWKTDAPMPTPRHGIGAAVVNGTVYLPGGAILQGFGATAVSEAFIPVVPPRRRAVISAAQ
jgi:N-acetylneuraminic acid mutarotase